MSAAPPTMSVDETIRHYQRSIERSQNDPRRILHCLNKLQRMEVTVTHLQSTGIGRTVNILRKDHGEVGSLAKSLITKWKQMVASETSDHSEEEKSENDLSAQEEMVDSSQKAHRHHEHSSSTSSSRHKSGSNRDHSKQHQHHSQKSHHREQKNVVEENDEQSTKRRNSHDPDRNGHKSAHHKDNHRHRKTENHYDGEPQNDIKHHKRSNESDSVSSTSSSHKRHRKHETEQSSSSKRHKCDSTTSPSSIQSKEKKSKSKSKTKPIDDGIEIDNSTGTSFADALGMIEPIPKNKSSLSSASMKSKNSSLSSLSSSSLGKEKQSSSQEKNKHKDKEKSKPSTSSSSNRSNTPKLLTEKAELPPLDDLLKDLPPPAECIIRNDYKPLPVNALVMDCLYRPNNSKLTIANEADALCASTTSKNQRTKVYSGTKTGQLLSVPSLHELCIRFLQKNIDALEYTGGVPFEILRPVLERASPNQLFTFEHFNPYLMEDSDILWQQHCKNKFKAYKRQEMETWREMYSRCEKEQEERLASLANNIKKSISVAVPVRQTMLAYVDTAVKPPRGIVKKQNQFGTHSKLVATPAARVDALSSVATNMARVGDVRLRTSAAMRDTAQAQPSNGTLKTRKAPLMMKTLQLMKGRFKR